MFRTVGAVMLGRGGRKVAAASSKGKAGSTDFFLHPTASPILQKFSVSSVPPQLSREKSNVLMLDCRATSRKRLADISLINRINKALATYEAAANASVMAEAVSNPFVVLVASNLDEEDAQMQQLVLRNALLMYPVSKALPTPSVWVLTKEQSAALNQELPITIVPVEWLATRTREKISVSASTAPSAKDVEVAPRAEESSSAKLAAKKATAKRREESPKKRDNKTAAAATTAASPVAVEAAAPQQQLSAVKKDAVVKSNATTTTPQPPPAAVAPVEATPTGEFFGFQDTDMEKELWCSPTAKPADLSVMHSLLDTTSYVDLLKRVSSSSSSSNTPTDVYVLVYRLGKSSTVQSFWKGALHAVGRYHESITGSDALRGGIAAYELALEQAQAQVVMGGTSIRRRQGEARLASIQVERSTTPPTKQPGRGKPAEKAQKQDAVSSNDNSPRGVYLIVHANFLVGGDVELLQREMLALYHALPPPLQQLFLGVQVVAASRITEWNLLYLLKHTARSAAAGGAMISPQPNVFRDAYRGLSAPLVNAGASTAGMLSAPSSSEAFFTPDVLVSQAARVAEVCASILQQQQQVPPPQQHQQRQEPQSLGADIVAQLQKMQESGGSDEVSRAAQRVEMKNMMMDAVEEVSVRHEQATAHLVKSLSSLVAPWTTDELMDRVEAVMKDQLESVKEGIHLVVQSLDTRTAALELHVKEIHSAVSNMRVSSSSEDSSSSAEGQVFVSSNNNAAESHTTESINALQEKVSSLSESMLTKEDVADIIDSKLAGFVSQVSDVVANAAASAAPVHSTPAAVSAEEVDSAPSGSALEPYHLQRTEDRILNALFDIEAMLTVMGCNDGGEGSSKESTRRALDTTRRVVHQAVEEGLRAPELLEKLETDIKQKLEAAVASAVIATTNGAAGQDDHSPLAEVVPTHAVDGEDGSLVIRQLRRSSGYAQRRGTRLRNGKETDEQHSGGVDHQGGGEKLSDLALQMSLMQPRLQSMERNLQKCIRQEVQRAVAAQHSAAGGADTNGSQKD